MGTEPNEYLKQLSEQDIVEAMRAMEGYIDITPGDFKELYKRAYCHAMERMERTVLARQMMRSEVVCVRTDTPLSEVAARMAAHRISGVPVLGEGEELAGMITEKDFLRRMNAGAEGSFMEVVANCLANTGCSALGIKNRPAAAIMTSPVISVGPEATAREIAAIMTDHAISSLPVVADKRLAGILTRTDLIRATQLEEASCPTSPR